MESIVVEEQVQAIVSLLRECSIKATQIDNGIKELNNLFSKFGRGVGPVMARNFVVDGMIDMEALNNHFRDHYEEFKKCSSRPEELFEFLQLTSKLIHEHEGCFEMVSEELLHFARKEELLFAHETKTASMEELAELVDLMTGKKKADPFAGINFDSILKKGPGNH